MIFDDFREYYTIYINVQPRPTADHMPYWLRMLRRQLFRPWLAVLCGLGNAIPENAACLHGRFAACAKRENQIPFDTGYWQLPRWGNYCVKSVLDSRLSRLCTVTVRMPVCLYQRWSRIYTIYIYIWIYRGLSMVPPSLVLHRFATTIPLQVFVLPGLVTWQQWGRAREPQENRVEIP